MHAAAQKAKKQMVDFFNYTDNPRFYVVVDCIIFGYSEDKLKILVRQFDTDSGQKTYRLHGGFVQENEDLDDVATRIIRERTGVEEEYTDQVGTWGKQKRDPKARVISVAYYTLLNIAECDAEKIARYNSFWVDVDTLPELQLDHADMVQIALFQLRMFVGRKPIGFHLLPDMFTLTQLQRMHEAVLGGEAGQTQLPPPRGRDELHRQKRPDRQAAQQARRSTLSIRRANVQIFQQV